MRYDKLIRDKIPEIIEQKGGKSITHIAEREEYERKLKEKLLEEVKEFIELSSAEEMADIFEVLDAICEQLGFSKDEVERIKKEKFEQRGGFKKKLILEES